MQKTEMIEKLEKLYKDPKSQNFVLHLVRSYLPLDKANKVWSKPADMKKFKCVLTDAKLISIDEVFSHIHGDEAKETFKEGMKNLAQGMREDKPVSTDLFGMQQFLNGRILGYQGENTTTYICEEALVVVHDWVVNKIMCGDGKINWTLRNMKAKNFLSQFSGFNDSETKQQVKRIEKVVNKPATAKLGDMDVLKQLQEKLKKAEQGEK